MSGVAERKIRVLIGKPGLDGHDRGAKIVATAIQEDVDAIGLSVLSGAHNHLFGRVLDLLREKGVDDVTLFGGGIVPPEDIERLKQLGVRAIFTPGTSTRDIVAFVREQVRPGRL